MSVAQGLRARIHCKIDDFFFCFKMWLGEVALRDVFLKFKDVMNFEHKNFSFECIFMGLNNHNRVVKIKYWQQGHKCMKEGSSKCMRDVGKGLMMSYVSLY